MLMFAAAAAGEVRGQAGSPGQTGALGQAVAPEQNTGTGRAPGQETVRGVVWNAPSDARRAAEDLIEMQAVGVQAVRTEMVMDDALLELADTLGITLYRELPGVYQSARDLEEGEAVADSLVRVMAGQVSVYGFAGPIGLAYRADTTDPASCAVLERLTRSAKAVSPSARTYYVTRFLRDDVCRDAVDFVLVDVLGATRPEVLAGRARQKFGGSVGIGAVGSPVEGDSLAGANVPGSPHHQARYLENALGALLGMQLEAVFVHRWRDGQDDKALDPYGRRYGLYFGAGNPRPALQVVRGIFLGTQTVFAFDIARDVEAPAPWFTLLGWVLIIVIAAMYAGSPRFRVMIPRYFLAHGFYRNAVREAREVLPMTSTALLSVMGLAIGMLGTLVVTSLRSTDAAYWLYARMDPALRIVVTSLIDAPLALVVIIGSAGLVGITAWMAIWMAVTMRRSPLLPSQALMLAVWPRYPILILVVLAMILQTEPGRGDALVVGGIATAWLLSALWSSIRTAYDLYKVVHLSPWTAVAVWLLNTAVLLVAGTGIWAMLNPDDAAHLWHLIVRR